MEHFVSNLVARESTANEIKSKFGTELGGLWIHVIFSTTLKLRVVG
jgi:hypothetical protein